MSFITGFIDIVAGLFDIIFGCINLTELSAPQKKNFFRILPVIVFCLILSLICIRPSHTTDTQGTEHEISEATETFTSTAGTEIMDVSAETLIKENLSEITQKKNAYTNSDIFESENRYVNLMVWEHAGYLYCISADENESTCEILGGKGLPSVRVILLDYNTDTIIRSYKSGPKGDIRHYAENKNTPFYCVAFAPSYDIYVSQPICVTGDNADKFSGLIGLYLSKSSDTYTEPSYIQIFIRDTTNPALEFSALSRGAAAFRCIKNSSENIDHESYDSMYYTVWTDDSGFLSRGESNLFYFKLNSSYSLDVTPNFIDKSTNIIPYFYDMSYLNIKEFVDNSNIQELYFEYDGNKMTPYEM